MSQQTVSLETARKRAGEAPVQTPSPAPEPPPNLHQRKLAVVAALVRGVKATSTNAFKAPAIGIDDVEAALAPLIAEHGIDTEWTQGSPPQRDKDGWMVHLRLRLVNADDPDDASEWSDWWETGSNIAAACSYGRKGALKAPFHIAAKEDEKGGAEPEKSRAQARSTATRSAAPRSGAASVRRLPVPGRACPTCGDGWVVVYGDQGSFVGHQTYPSPCREGVDDALRRQYIVEAETAAASAKPTELSEDDLIVSAIERMHDYAGLDAAAATSLIQRHHWSKGQDPDDWVRTLDHAALIKLLSDFNAAIRDCPKDIPT